MLCVCCVWRGTGQARFRPLSAILTARQAGRRTCLVCEDLNKSDALLVLASLCRRKARTAATVCQYQKKRRLVLTCAYVCLRVHRLQLPAAKTVVLRCPVLRDERDGACATEALDGRVLPAMIAARPAGERRLLCGPSELHDKKLTVAALNWQPSPYRRYVRHVLRIA